VATYFTEQQEHLTAHFIIPLGLKNTTNSIKCTN